MASTKYKKRPGTSGIRGQLYETKLISLIHFRAVHDDSIENYCLGTNIDKIGAFDDICFKVKVKGFDRPFAVFIQAKHKENYKQALSIKSDLDKYFHSYLKIKSTFGTSNNDPLFEGKFDDVECLFVMYTPAKDDCHNDLIESNFASNLNDLIETGGTAKRPYKNEEDVKFLCKIAMHEQISTLARQMAELICDDRKFGFLLTDELMLRYHVILTQKVIDVTEIQPGGHRIAFFRQDFFDTNEEVVMLLKDTLYIEILKKRKLPEGEIKDLLLEFFDKPLEITILSKLIGNVIVYKNGQLVFVNKTATETLKRQLNKVYVPLWIINQAVELAAIEILQSRKFRVPAGFGNKDLTVRGNDVKIENRLNYLSSKFIDLLDKSKPSNIVTIDESLGDGFLQHNGGIASAVGNILVPDGSTKRLKFSDNSEFQGNLAKRLFEKLERSILNLHGYKFNLKVKKFPKHSFDCSENDENLARDFLNSLLFYSNQADETGVGKILKDEIEADQRNNVDHFRVRTDAIFLKYHDAIQNWWMLPKEASYLKKENKMYENAMRPIIEDPLMSVIHMIYMNKMNNLKYTFTEDALRSLKLQDQLLSTVIVTDNISLTVAKVIQYLKNADCVVLDLEYIVNLSTIDRIEICEEFTKINERKILILVCDKIQNSRNCRNTMEIVAKAVNNKRIIIITNEMSDVLVKRHFSRDNEVNNVRTKLIDMSEESQKKIINSAKVVFQGQEVRFDLIVDDELKEFVERDVLNKIIGNEAIIVGKSISDVKYDEMKHLYIDRRVKELGDNIIQTLNDIENDVVVITAKPGMGKSTLLTHLSLKTKKLDPKVWIVRINLLEHTEEFSTWQDDKTTIDLLETLKFVIQASLSEAHGRKKQITIALEESNGVVYLKDCTAGPCTVFEIKIFLHFYNKGKIIFLLDGFDEICPHYTNQVMQCLKIISNYPRKHKLWVASRSYNEIISVLVQEFGMYYEIEHFSYNDHEKYLELFWESNLILKDLSSAQLDNVNDFIEFMSKLENRKLQSFELTLHEVYINAVIYLINQIKHSYIPLWTYDTTVVDEHYYKTRLFNKMGHFYGFDSDVGIPLHLYLIADYFKNEVKDINKKTDKWNLDINTYTVYDRFIETKLKKIRFQEKNKMEIHKPDIMITYEKERADFINKHKKLGAYAIFHLHKHKLFNSKGLEDIKDIIKFINKGGEKTGLIYSVANNIPTFIHMTFAEYFAAGYVCDLVKNEKCRKKQKFLLDFLFKTMFSLSSHIKVRDFIDYKMKVDTELISVLENNRKVIFDLLLEQGKVFSEHMTHFNRVKTIPIGCYWALTSAAAEKLRNFMFFFKSLFESCLTVDNVDEFIKIIRESIIVTRPRISQWDEWIIFLLDIVKKIDHSKFHSVLFDNFSYLPRSMNYDVMSGKEIVDLIHKESIVYANRNYQN